MSPSTDRQTFRETLAGLAEKTKAKIPALNGRLEKACKLVLAGDVELHDDGTALVNSLSDPTRAYQLAQGVCQCRDWGQAPEHLCAHRLAAGFLRKVQELAPPVETAPAPASPADPPALPEVAFSLTLKGTLDGQDALLTVRGMTAAEFQANLAAVRALLDRPAPPPPATPQCPVHGALKQSKKGKGWYCPRQLDDGTWCKRLSGNRAWQNTRLIR